MKQRMQKLFVEYGVIAIGIYFVIFFSVWLGFFIAVKTGVEVGPGMSQKITDVEAWVAGKLPAWTGHFASTIAMAFVAWVATKLTQPLRIVVTLVSTPFIARLFFKSRYAPDKSRDHRR
jgi:hypothetical protein